MFFQVAIRANTDEKKMAIRKDNDGKIVFSSEKPPTPLLDTINYPVHMKNLSTKVPSLFPYVISGTFNKILYPNIFKRHR